MDAAGRSEHELLILRRAARGRVDVFMVDGGGGWALPRLEAEERRSADVAELNQAVRATLGLEVTVLRCLYDEPGAGERPRRHVYVLEAHTSTAGSRLRSRQARHASPEAGREPSHAATDSAWVADDALAARGAGGSRARVALDAWRRHERIGAATPASSASRSAPPPDWTTLGWRDEVLAWASRQIAAHGSASPDPAARELAARESSGRPPRGQRAAARIVAVEQIRLWEFSHILRLGAGGAAFYLKARPHDGAVEAPLTALLAARHPAWMPSIVGVEQSRRWLLTREAPGVSLMAAEDPARWERAAATIARMQIDWVSRVEELTALGCPRLSLGALEHDLAPMLDDREALQPHRAPAAFGDGDPVLGEGLLAPTPNLADGLSDEEVADLRRRRPEAEALCRALAAAGVPDSLEHGDLWGDNAIAGPDCVVFIDWEDAAVTHPFFTPSLLLLSLDYTAALARVPDARARIRSAYLAPWRERGPLADWPLPRLDRVFDLARRVAMLHYARQFWRLALPVIETSWEVRAFVPLFLRRFLTS